MPMDSSVSQSPLSEDWGLRRAVGWKLKLCWSPRTCFLSGKKLWGKRAYHGENWITGPGDPAVQEYWIDKKEYIMWRLKGNYG